jgi:hypothetical protein
MDDVTKQILAQATTALIQGAFTYLAQAGMSGEDIDALFEKERRKFKARHPSQLPKPDTKGELETPPISVDPMPDELKGQG